MGHLWRDVVLLQSFDARLHTLSRHGWVQKNGPDTHTHSTKTAQHKSVLHRKGTNRHRTTSSVWLIVISRGVARVLSMGAVYVETFVAAWAPIDFVFAHSRIFSAEKGANSARHKSVLGT